jgi:hypothetical protein
MENNVRWACPVAGCDYETGVYMSGGDTLGPEVHAERVERLRAQHPAHPPSAYVSSARDRPRSASERALDRAMNDYAYDLDLMTNEPN